jgi:hypothetical protein
MRRQIEQLQAVSERGLLGTSILIDPQWHDVCITRTSFPRMPAARTVDETHCAGRPSQRDTCTARLGYAVVVDAPKGVEAWFHIDVS